jgi:hypothetical protein
MHGHPPLHIKLIPTAVALAAALIAAPALAQPASFVDARPEADRAFSKGAMSVASCDYMIYGYGDEQVAGRVARLEADLKAALGERLAGRQVVVQRYGLFLNAQDTTRSGAMSMAVASVGGVGTPSSRIAPSRCDREKMKGGWLSPSDTLTGNDPFVAEIAVTVDGRPFTARAAWSSPDSMGRCGAIKGSKCMAAPATVKGLDAVQAAANQALAQQIAAAFPES